MQMQDGGSPCGIEIQNFGNEISKIKQGLRLVQSLQNTRLLYNILLVGILFYYNSILRRTKNVKECKVIDVAGLNFHSPSISLAKVQFSKVVRFLLQASYKNKKDIK